MFFFFFCKKNTFLKKKKQSQKKRFTSLIPLHKLNHPSFKSLFARMGKVLPSETAARACVAKLASQKEKQIQELFRDKKTFLIVDEAEVAKQKYISMLVSSLDAPNQTFLVIAIHLTAVAMLIAVLFCTLWMTYCDNLK